MDRKDQAPTAASRGAVVEEEVIPVVEEQLAISRRPLEGRTVTVRTRPVSETVEVAEPVSREAIEVERVPVGKVVEKAPAMREEGDVTIIPVVEERLVVNVELVVTEEIHLRRTRSTDNTTHSVELRKTEVDISE